MITTVALTGAGILQSYLQYVAGQPYMEVQQHLTPFYWIRLGGGIVTALGLVLHLAALLLPARQPRLAFAAAE